MGSKSTATFPPSSDRFERDDLRPRGQHRAAFIFARSSPARRGGGIGRQALNDGIRTVVLMAVPAEDDDGWQVEFERDDGQRQRVLHFPSKKDAELWIADPNL